MDDASLAACLGQELLAQGKTIAFAESCSGGLASSLVTDVAGSSAYLLGSVVSYTNQVKNKVLNVQQESLTHAPPKGEVQSGKCGTFAMRVYFRQNASWQGSVSWLEGDREERFRSVLELAFLLNSALSGEEPPKKAKRTSA